MLKKIHYISDHTSRQYHSAAWNVLALVWVMWILIGCQCFYCSTPGKKIILKVIPMILFLY